MLKWKKTAVAGLAAFSVLFLAACARQMDPEPSCNFVQNGALQRVSWKDDLPLKLYIHESIQRQDFIDAIRNAAQQWNEALGRNAVIIEASRVGGPLNARRDGYSMVYLYSQWDADKPTEQARTTIHWSGDKIYEADIRFNDKNFDFFTDETGRNFGGVHLESLALHEIGHALGLAHTAQSGSVMVTTLGSGQVRDKVADIDKTSLTCEY